MIHRAQGKPANKAGNEVKGHSKVAAPHHNPNIKTGRFLKESVEALRRMHVKNKDG